jgi:hypothetical protein
MEEKGKAYLKSGMRRNIKLATDNISAQVLQLLRPV